ncbi:hypothetical protein [Roseivivax marinus]|uniref:AbiTii domain-containing protein n=1 Tax=Roseivivax marinus TaxID=1379903 RepID=UPI00103C7AA7|nr:hypothetical protein [Roseivivax marinus]
MGLLRDLQTSLMNGENIGPILLKLRYLASRLGSDPLGEWVKFESEGYPSSAEVPDYRIIGVTYIGTFSGAFGSGIQNAPIPPYIIRKEAGEDWGSYKVRQSVASIDSLTANAKDTGTLEINAANLILLLQGKIYPEYAINSVTGKIGAASLVELQNAVRARVLELTIQIEKAVPLAAEITLDHDEKIKAEDSQKVNQVTKQIVHGNLTQISNTGDNSSIILQVGQRDKNSVIEALSSKGLSRAEAVEFAEILAEEEPESVDEPFGEKAKTWIANKTGKMATGVWNMGIAAGTKVLTEAALKYYGLK